MELYHVLFIFSLVFFLETLAVGLISGFFIFDGLIILLILGPLISGLICYFKDRHNNFP